MNILQEYCYQTLATELNEKFRQRDNTVMQMIHNRDTEAILSRAQRVRLKIHAAVDASFPACELRPRVTSRIECNGYAIENVIIQEIPNVFIPINVYVPAACSDRCPAVVIPMGHWPRGKAVEDNQILCANLAMQGFVVATYDPICQGERTLVQPEDFPARFGDMPEDLYAVAMHMVPGNLFYLMGKNLISLFIHDGIRVIDYICSRPDVDADRIGVTGQSGGGTQTTFLAAMDPRVKVYSPIQCLSKQALLIQKSGIGDCEQSLLNISRDEGFEYPDILWASLPKPLMVSSGRRDFFYIEGIRQLESEMSLIYDLLGKAEDFSVNVAECAHQISPATRMFAYLWLNHTLLGRDVDVQEQEITIQPESAIACLPAGTPSGSPMEAVRHLFAQEKAKRPADARQRLEQLKQLLHISSRRATVEPICNGGNILHVDGARSISFTDTGSSDRPICLVISEDASLCANLSQTYRVVNAMPWGMQSAYDKKQHGYDADTRLFNLSAVLGESLMADRVNETVALAEYLCEISGQQQIYLVGKDAGAWPAMLAAAVSDRFKKTVLFGFYNSLDALFAGENYLLSESLIVPGICAVGDLDEICALAKHPVLRIRPTDACGQPIATTILPVAATSQSESMEVISFFH